MKNPITKFAIAFILCFAAFYASVWFFNHVNAWLGITILFISLLILANVIKKKLKI